MLEAGKQRQTSYLLQSSHRHHHGVRRGCCGAAALLLSPHRGLLLRQAAHGVKVLPVHQPYLQHQGGRPMRNEQQEVHPALSLARLAGKPSWRVQPSAAHHDAVGATGKQPRPQRRAQRHFEEQAAQQKGVGRQ